MKRCIAIATPFIYGSHRRRRHHHASDFMEWQNYKNESTKRKRKSPRSREKRSYSSEMKEISITPLHFSSLLLLSIPAW